MIDNGDAFSAALAGLDMITMVGAEVPVAREAAAEARSSLSASGRGRTSPTSMRRLAELPPAGGVSVEFGEQAKGQTELEARTT